MVPFNLCAEKPFLHLKTYPIKEHCIEAMTLKFLPDGTSNPLKRAPISP